MFAARYFCNRYFAPRYFAKAGADPDPGSSDTNQARVLLVDPGRLI